MIHPFYRLLATRPQLLLEHLGGYADLAAAQLQLTLGIVLARAALVGCFAGLLLLATLLGGAALLLVGAIPVAQMPMPWLLWLTPLVPLLGALVCLVLLKQRPLMMPMDALREQVALDAALFRDLGAKP